jgi:light-regulated signal transduction histidine kinase (bacteriophytochrome)
VSHDLRAPLRSIDGFSRLLLAKHGTDFDEESASHLSRICAATKRMADLIDDLLNLARLSRSPLQRETVDLADLARSIVEELRHRDSSRRVVVEIESGLTAQADARLVMAALENLLGNAWKFTAGRDEAHIRVGRRSSGKASAFFVQDDGAGFDMAYADRLFQAFYRLHTTREFEGTGIGLATVHRIVERHGGRIWAEAAPAKGATFLFTLAE